MPDKIKLVLTVSALFLISAAPVSGTGGAGTDERGLDFFIPGDINSLIVFPDVAGLIHKVQDGPLETFLKERENSEGHEGRLAYFINIIRDAEDQKGAEPADFRELFDGQAALAIRKSLSPDTQEAGIKSTLYQLQARPGQSEAIDDLVSSVTSYLKLEKGLIAEERDISGRKVYYVDWQCEKGCRSGSNPSYISFSDKVLSVLDAPDKSLLADHFALLDGEADRAGSVAGLKIYRDLTIGAPVDADYISFKNLQMFWESARARMDFETETEWFSPAHLLDAMVFSPLKGSVSFVQLSSEGLRWDGRLAMDAEDKGVWEAISPGTLPDVGPPAFVDERSVFFAGAYLNLPVFINQFGAAVSKHHPELYEETGLLGVMPEGAERAFRDVAESVAGQWFVHIPYNSKSGAASDGDVPGNMLFAAGLKSPERLMDSLADFFDHLAYPHNITSYNGRPVVESRHFAMTVMDDLVLISPRRDLIVETIAGGGRSSSPLKENRKFKKDLLRLVPGPIFFSYADAEIFTDKAVPLLVSFFDSDGPALHGFSEILAGASRISVSGAWEEDVLRFVAWMPYTGF